MLRSKRRKVLASLAHLVEIDLLRQWPPMPVLNYPYTSNYRILVSRSSMRPQATLYPFNLSNPIPAIFVPLEGDDPDQVLDLQALLTEIYDFGSYDLRIDYQKPPLPPLTDAEMGWIDQQLRARGLR